MIYNYIFINNSYTIYQDVYGYYLYNNINILSLNDKFSNYSFKNNNDILLITNVIKFFI
jgi:hypothetical protein